jgi:serine O-acetyltransferase
VVGAGAKILGPFTVADDARIGSNAVVLDAVPVGATVVGVPGRIVRCKDDNAKCLELVREKQERHRLVRTQSRAQLFDAYGVAGETDDPMEVAVELLQQQVAEMRAELDQLRKKAC